MLSRDSVAWHHSCVSSPNTGIRKPAKVSRGDVARGHTRPKEPRFTTAPNEPGFTAASIEPGFTIKESDKKLTFLLSYYLMHCADETSINSLKV